MEEKELKKQITTIERQVGTIVITDQGTYEMACRAVININEFIKVIEDYWESPIKDANALHKSLTKKRSDMVNPPKKQKLLLTQKINKHLTDEENKRREAQRKLDEDRKKKEAAEKKKLEDRAAKAEEKGKIEKAEELRDQAEDVYIAPAEIKPEIEKTTRMESGTASASNDIEVIINDEMAVLKHIISGTLPISIMTISVPKLKAACKMHQIKRLEGVIINPVVKAKYRGK